MIEDAPRSISLCTSAQLSRRPITIWRTLVAL
jgi:hypothetical protein